MHSIHTFPYIVWILCIQKSNHDPPGIILHSNLGTGNGGWTNSHQPSKTALLFLYYSSTSYY